MRDSHITGKERVDHILKAIADIETFTKDSSKELFLNDFVLINAILFQFSIIGEAIIYIDSALLSKYDYPWYKVRGFRNFILHEYHAIEYRTVWDTVKKDLPELKKMIALIKAEEY